MTRETCLIDDDEQQRAALKIACEPGAAVLVVGGPGTGKSTLLVESVVQRVRSGTPFAEIVVLTLTRSRAQEMRKKIVSSLRQSVLAPRVMTIHSFCLALHRRFSQDEIVPRLLTAPEQDFRIQELISGSDPQRWPIHLRPAAQTIAFAAQVREAITTIRQLSLDPCDVITEGRVRGHDDWVAVGEFLAEYLDVLGFENSVDYSELVHRTRLLLQDPHTRIACEREFQAIYCDEFAELDEAQFSLLAELRETGAAIVAFADPSTSVYGFRGANTDAVKEFTKRFASRGRTPPQVVTLRTNHRSTPGVVSALNAVSRRLGFDAGPVSSDSGVSVVSFRSAQVQSDYIAHLLVQAHHEGLAWNDMAVITRGAVKEVARTLEIAGIPIDIDGGDLPLADEPAVRLLLDALAYLVALVDDEPVLESAALRLITSPLCGLDATEVRRVGRVLRNLARASVSEHENAMPSSTQLITRILLHGCGDHDDPAVVAIAELGNLLANLAQRVREGLAPQIVAWTLWSETAWSHRVQREALGNDWDATRAHRDLDALCDVFDLISRLETSPGIKGLKTMLAYLSGQVTPADMARESELHKEGVHVLTAHRAKGRQWSLVVLPSVQEGIWPSRRRSSLLLQQEWLTGQTITSREVVTAERKLFLLALSRARDRVVVTGVQQAEDGISLSRFLTEIGVTVEEVTERSFRPSNLKNFVAELRRTSVDPRVSPGLRRAAAVQLGKLACQYDDLGCRLVPQADPKNWWGIRKKSDIHSDESVAGHLRLSVSDIEGLLTCPRQWFLAKKAAGAPTSSSAMVFGGVIHALAEQLQQGTLSRQQVDEELDAVFPGLTAASPWGAENEREEAGLAIDRLEEWLNRRSSELVRTEANFTFEVFVGDMPVNVVGVVDRLEKDHDGRLKVIDFKTSKRAASKASVAQNMQLGLYQWAVAQGCFDGDAPGERRCANAALVYLRLGKRGPTIREQPSLDEEPSGGLDLPGGCRHWVEAKLAEAVAFVRDENYVARPGQACRNCAFAMGCPSKVAGRKRG